MRLSVRCCDQGMIEDVLTAGADTLVGLAVLTETVVLWKWVREGIVRVERWKDKPVGL